MLLAFLNTPLFVLRPLQIVAVLLMFELAKIILASALATVIRMFLVPNQHDHTH